LGAVRFALLDGMWYLGERKWGSRTPLSSYRPSHAVGGSGCVMSDAVAVALISQIGAFIALYARIHSNTALIESLRAEVAFLRAEVTSYVGK
jgi:hypothetical protein